MGPFCFFHAENARASGLNISRNAFNRGPCCEPECEGIGFYALIKETVPNPAKESVERLQQAPAPNPEPEWNPELNGARSIRCDNSGTCPHCLLSRISTVSTFCIPLERGLPREGGSQREPTFKTQSGD